MPNPFVPSLPATVRSQPSTSSLDSPRHSLLPNANLLSASFPTPQAVANRTGSSPRCAAVVLRVGPYGNTTDLVAEHNHFQCPPHAAVGGYDAAGCVHCSVGR